MKVVKLRVFENRNNEEVLGLFSPAVIKVDDDVTLSSLESDFNLFLASYDLRAADLEVIENVDPDEYEDDECGGVVPYEHFKEYVDINSHMLKTN